MKSGVVETEIDQQWLGKDEKLCVIASPNAEVTLENACKINAMQTQLACGKKGNTGRYQPGKINQPRSPGALFWGSCWKSCTGIGAGDRFSNWQDFWQLFFQIEQAIAPGQAVYLKDRGGRMVENISRLRDGQMCFFICEFVE